jgi:hypothetical protein
MLTPPQRISNVFFIVITLTLSILMAGCLGEDDSEIGGTLEIVNDANSRIPYQLYFETTEETVQFYAQGYANPGRAESYSENWDGDVFVGFTGTIGSTYVSGNLENGETVTYRVNEDYTISMDDNDSSNFLFVIIVIAVIFIVIAGIVLIVSQIVIRGAGSVNGPQAPIQSIPHQTTPSQGYGYAPTTPAGTGFTGHQPVQPHSAATRNCPNCGNGNSTDATHCVMCLAILPQQQVAMPSQPMVQAVSMKTCPQCGSINNPIAQSCISCLYSLYPVDKPQYDRD